MPCTNVHSHTSFLILVKSSSGNRQTIPNQQCTVVECVVCCNWQNTFWRVPMGGKLDWLYAKSTLVEKIHKCDHALPSSPLQAWEWHYSLDVQQLAAPSSSHEDIYFQYWTGYELNKQKKNSSIHWGSNTGSLFWSACAPRTEPRPIDYRHSSRPSIYRIVPSKRHWALTAQAQKIGGGPLHWEPAQTFKLPPGKHPPPTS